MTEGMRLYLPSTPFNLLLSFLDALSRGGDNVLVYIDQKAMSPYLDSLLSLQSSPFCEVFVLYGAATGKEKLDERRQNFKALSALLDRYDFSEVITGSDRRIEFQYVMHLIQETNNDVTGSYLDDGLYTYLTWKRPFYEHFLNAIVKKIIYGLWWHEPRTPGTSKYVSRSILMDARLALDSLKSRDVITIDFSLLSSAVLTEWTEKLLNAFNCNVSQISEIDVFFILPHPNDVKKMPGYVLQLNDSIKTSIEKGQKIAVKYHPRFTEVDEFNLGSSGAMLVPSNLAFEFLLPVLKAHAKVVGDFTTVMLTSKMLRSDLQVTANINMNDLYQLQILDVLKKFKIEIIEKSN
ncbi:hypothetical protein [Hydrogenovibrio kuenenii]|uniref:hypothetical protein n=1 Tax=Hydrogenovibrio kuenenii TaxID=63658 RepID=UPI000464D04E|nr:hypothetical protein [Hydrogenovibrio kuenenii]